MAAFRTTIDWITTFLGLYTLCTILFGIYKKFIFRRERGHMCPNIGHGFRYGHEFFGKSDNVYDYAFFIKIKDSLHGKRFNNLTGTIHIIFAGTDQGMDRLQFRPVTKVVVSGKLSSEGSIPWESTRDIQRTISKSQFV